MNTSRDIEKLFDHFGGNAAGYQEIGRENEANAARARWPLLATLDLAQPEIPEIAPRREIPIKQQPREPESLNGAPTSINRGKPPLFARLHRRAIPPVDAPASLSVSAARFSPPTGTGTGSAPAPTQTPYIPPQSLASELSRDADPQPSAKAAQDPAPTQNAAASPSILGKLFRPATTEPAPTPQSDGSLQAIFDRLRHVQTETPSASNANVPRRFSRS